MDIIKRELHNIKNRDAKSDINLKPIGVLHSSLKTLKGIPIQFSMSDTKGRIEIFEEFTSGLKDLDGFSHVYCIYFFDLVRLPVPLQSKPFLDNTKKGVFATRTPFRPNPIGLSVLKLINIEDNLIFIKNVDILDKTPILDIKPYVKEFDTIKVSKSGWLESKVRKKLS
jgi:tRNA-Thr(GGU) m(6)t(6)A37 methyltransferase TsaA